jgi:hypothetical protein
VEGPSFGDLAFYAGSLGLPEGDYAVEFFTQMFQPTKQDGTSVGDPFLAVMLNCYPLAGGEPVEHAVSMGQKAKNIFVPSADGKGLAPVPGGSGSLSDMSNWGIFLKSMYDCGLPQGVFTNSLATLDGIHVHVQNIPEPEGRKEMRARNRTGESTGEPDTRTRTISVVTEIKEDGKPWEGTGGLPTAGTLPTKKAGPKGIVKAAPAAAAPVAEAEGGEADVEQAALAGVTSVLEQPANANGMIKLKLRTGTFTAVKAAVGDDMAQAVQETYFGDDKALNGLLGQLGYALKAGQVVPQS